MQVQPVEMEARKSTPSRYISCQEHCFYSRAPLYDFCPRSAVLEAPHAKRERLALDTFAASYLTSACADASYALLQRDRRHRDAPGGTRNIQKIYRWDAGQRVSKFRAMLPLANNMEPYILGDFKEMQVPSLPAYKQHTWFCCAVSAKKWSAQTPFPNFGHNAALSCPRDGLNGTHRH